MGGCGQSRTTNIRRPGFGGNSIYLHALTVQEPVVMKGTKTKKVSKETGLIKVSKSGTPRTRAKLQLPETNGSGHRVNTVQTYCSIIYSLRD